MTDRAEHDILIGACGWQHTGWLGSFYPDDLPEDWRLPYYANEFQAVLVPEQDWIDQMPDQVETWLDDTEDDFVLFFALSPSTLHLAEKQTNLGDILALLDDHTTRIGGLVLTLPNEPVDRLPELPGSFRPTVPVIIDAGSETGKQDVLSLSQALDADVCWHAGNNHQHPPAKHCNIGFIDTSAAMDNKSLRVQFEEFCSILTPQCPSALFLTGEPPNISNLRDLRMIKELILG